MYLSEQFRNPMHIEIIRFLNGEKEFYPIALQFSKHLTSLHGCQNPAIWLQDINTFKDELFVAITLMEGMDICEYEAKRVLSTLLNPDQRMLEDDLETMFREVMYCLEACWKIGINPLIQFRNKLAILGYTVSHFPRHKIHGKYNPKGFAFETSVGYLDIFPLYKLNRG